MTDRALRRNKPLALSSICWFSPQLASSVSLSLLQSHGRQFLLQEGNTIVSPKHLAFDNKNRHAKDLVRIRPLLNSSQLSAAFPFEIGKESFWVHTDFRQDRRKRLPIFDVQFTLPETLIHAIVVGTKLALLPGIQHPDRRQRRIENL